MNKNIWYGHSKIFGLDKGSFRRKVKIGDNEIYMHVDLDYDGQCKKIAVDLAPDHNQNSLTRLTIQQIFKDISKGLESGKCLSEYCTYYIQNSRKNGDQMPVKGDDFIFTASSILDYVFTSLATEFNIEIPNLIFTVNQRNAKAESLQKPPHNGFKSMPTPP